MLRRLAPFLAVSLALAGCENFLTLQLQSGPQAFELTASAFAPPEELRDPESTEPRVGAVPCGPMGLCPGGESGAVACEADVCDPQPITFAAPVGAVVDIDELASAASDLLDHVDAIEILEAEYLIESNTLTTNVSEVEIFWGPEGTTAVDPAMGAVKLGTVPAIASGTAGSGQVALDAEGVAALSDFLVTTSPRRVQILARSSVDLEPGDRFPEGALRGTVDLRVRITGAVR